VSEPPDFGPLFNAHDLPSRVAVLRQLLGWAAGKDPAAIKLLLEMLPAIDVLLADVQGALTERN
jgi:hypothetical protein